MSLIICKINSQKNLEVWATEAGIEELEQGTSIYELFEEYAGNGSFTPFDAGRGEPYVGLTNAPCIAETLDYPDRGPSCIIGRFWYLADYMTFDEEAALRAGETVTYTLGSDPISYEIQVFPMHQEANGDARLIQDNETPDFYDVMYSERNEQHGSIEPLEEFENLTKAEASKISDALVIKYPEAGFEWYEL